MNYVVVLGEALLAAEPEEKVRIAHAIYELEDARAEAYLLDALGESDNQARAAVAYALSVSATHRSEERLIQLLDDSYFAVRVWAACGLAHLRSRAAVPRLIEALHDEEEGVVAAAVSALGEIVDRRAVEPLVGLLTGRRYISGVLLSLGSIGDPGVVEIIAGYLDDSDQDIRESALIALRRFPGSVPRAELQRLLEWERDAVNRGLASYLLGLEPN
ncbi:MAG: HEAT repeat domain-containing protein [Candidatus Bathyarchaeota archaeon]